MRPTEEQCTELGSFLIPFHERHADLPLDPVKAMAAIIETARDSVVFVARDPSGAIVGSIALFIDEPWYSRAPVIWNRWLCIDENHRDETLTLRSLLTQAKVEADRIGARLVIQRSNYRKGDFRGDFGKIAEAVGYMPFGHSTRLV